MSKYNVLKYSGSLKRIFVSLAVIVVSFGGIVTTYKINSSIFQMFLGMISAICFFASITIAFKDLILIIKILRNKYRIENKRLKSIDSRRPIDQVDKNQKILVFNNLRITVEKTFTQNLSVGDFITLVFADKVQYPIIIMKREACVNGDK